MNSDIGTVAVIGLGYVGLPLAVALARAFPTIGVDVDVRRIDEIRRHHDRTNELTPETLASSSLRLTTDIAEARDADIIIVTVPTPVDAGNQPDLRPVMGATTAIASVLRAGAGTIVVYESTVYPGVTEDVCGPELERLSGLERGVDFFLGYSPERINPGDRENTVDRIIKVVAGENPAVLDKLQRMYGTITTGGTYAAASIKVAEAAKVIENAQRDINIAFINEVTQIFAKLDISVYDVLDAARTKWNFLGFQPGLVGGHCIGVDPFYLSYAATQAGLDPKVVLSGRAINDGMGAWVADRVHERMSGRSHVLVLGISFKEDVPDLRNSRVIDVVRRLRWLGHEVDVHDPLADVAEARHEYGIELRTGPVEGQYDALIAAVPHQAYRDLGAGDLGARVKPGGLVADLKGIWRGRDLGPDLRYWSL